MNFIMNLFFVCICVGISSASAVGGWSKADPKSNEVIKATTFAVNKKYPDIAAGFKIVSAMKQVVAGMNYDLTVEVTLPEGSCKVDHYKVWDRFGDKTLVESDTLTDSCSTSGN